MPVSISKPIVPASRAFDATSPLSGVETRPQFLESPEWPLYSSLVAQHSRSTIFHSNGWARLVNETYRHRLMVLCLSAAEGDYSTDGISHRPQVLPLMEIHSPLTGRRGVSLPFADECPPLVDDAFSFSSLFSEATHLGEKRGWRHFECRGGTDLLEGCRPSIRYYGHRLVLNQPVDQLFAACDSAIRRGIRKAEREGIETEVADKEQGLREYYRLHEITRRKHGLPAQPWSFFQNLHRELIATEHGLVILARIGKRAIAGAVFLRHRNHAVYKFGASDPAFQGFRPNNLVMWRGIERLARDGCQVLEFGRTSLGHEGLRRFKLGWGTQEYPIQYLRWDIGQRRFIQSRDQVAGWHNHLFRILPPLCSRWLGFLLYRHLD